MHVSVGVLEVISLDIRQRGLYATNDTHISTAMTAGVNTAWLEAQTGVRYETLKRRYGKWLRTEGQISSKNSPVWPPSVAGEGKVANSLS